MVQRKRNDKRPWELARLIRAHILESTTAAESGHPTSALSAVEIVTTLFFGGHFRADLSHPDNPVNDRFILSKGHAAPLLYALYAAAGKVTRKELLTLRQAGSRLEGHPMPVFPYVEAPTGSLGQGLSVGLGMALNARMRRLPYRTWVLLGDSELSEGSVWEAVMLAAHERLGNLAAVVDVNRLGQAGQTMLGHNLAAYQKRFSAFGWHSKVVDGHNVRALDRVFAAVPKLRNRPTVVLARTVKGRGVSFLENKNGWHGKALTKDELVLALKEVGPVENRLRGRVAAPAVHPRSVKTRLHPRIPEPNYPSSAPIATRKACAEALVRLAPRYPNLVVLDGEVKNSTYTELFEHSYPKRFVETYIAEQNMVGISLGLALRGALPVAATFAAFWTRAFDQLRMAQYAGAHLVFIGTHAGASIGKDGASQMGLEDIALFRTLQNSIVLYPSDAYAAERLVEAALAARGIVYIRATRDGTPVLATPKTSFRIGGSRTLRSSRRDAATICAAGITVHEALDAADALARDGIRVRVIDCYSVKPLDRTALLKAARETRHLFVAEDHRPEGGLGEAVRTALGNDAGMVHSLAVRGKPASGSGRDVLARAGIDQTAVVRAVRRVL